MHGDAAAAPGRRRRLKRRASGIPSTYFSQVATPGETTPAGVLVLRNRTDHPVPVQLNRVNALTADGLGSAYDAAGKAPRGSTAWTRLGVVPARTHRPARPTGCGHQM